MSEDLRLRLIWPTFGRETHARTNYVQTNVEFLAIVLCVGRSASYLRTKRWQEIRH